MSSLGTGTSIKRGGIILDCIVIACGLKFMGFLFSCTFSLSNEYKRPKNRIGGVMVTVLTSSAVDREFEPRSSQTKNYEIGIYCLSAN